MKFLKDAISNIGVRGIDRMFCFMIKRELILMMKQYKRDVVGKSEWLQLLSNVKLTLNDGEGIIGKFHFYPV